MAAIIQTGALLLALAASTTATFDLNSKSNVLVYWGQGPNQKRLVETCKNPSVDIVTIGFINSFPANSPDTGYPGSNFGNQCGAEVYQVNGKDTLLYSHCPDIGPDITECQTKYGKTVILSLGGGWPTNYYLPDYDGGVAFADFLWDAFGPVDKQFQFESTVPRPFGNASVDGFDLDYENDISPPPTNPKTGEAITDYKTSGLLGLTNRFKWDLFTLDSGKKYYLSGAPICAEDEHYPSEVQDNLDFMTVQFYNNPKCLATQPETSWATWNNNVPSSRKYLFGLPAAPEAAGTGYYINQTQAYNTLKTVSSSPHFAGVGLWESTYSQNNKLCDKEYADWMKVYVNAIAAGTNPVDANTCQVSSTSSSSTMSSTTSSSASSSSSVSLSSSTSGSVSASATSSTSASTSTSVSASSSSHVTGSASSSGVSSSSHAGASSSVSASCLSKPSDIHTKSRTRAPHPIGTCSVGCNSHSSYGTGSSDSPSSVKPATSSSKTSVASSGTGSAVTSSKSSSSTYTQTRSIPTVCSTKKITTSCAKKASSTALSSLSVSSSAHSTSKTSSIVISSSASASRSSSAVVSSSTSPVTTNNYDVPPVYESTSSAAISSSSSAVVSSSTGAVITSSYGVPPVYESSSSAVIPSSSGAIPSSSTIVPPVYETSTSAAISSSTAKESCTSGKVPTTSPVSSKASSSTAKPSSSATDSTSSAKVTSSVPAPPEYESSSSVKVTSSAPQPPKYESTSSAEVTSSIPAYESSSSVKVTSSVPASETTSAAVVTSSAPRPPKYDTTSAIEITSSAPLPPKYETTSAAVVTSSAPQPPKYETTSTAEVSSSAPVYESSWTSVVSSSSSAAIVSSASVTSTSVKPGVSSAAQSTTSLAPRPTGYEQEESNEDEGDYEDEEEVSTSGASAVVSKTSAPAGDYQPMPTKYGGNSPDQPVDYASTSVAAGATKSVSTVIVYPVGATNAPMAYGSSTTSAKPAVYTGAAVKQNVFSGMIAVVLGAALLVL